jgi:glycosyltransferase involved in cell wall biosynthesis
LVSVITRTSRRPKALARCVESLRCQTSQDYEHIIIDDPVGVGIPETYVRLRTQSVDGDWVFILDDDNELTHPRFIEKVNRVDPDRYGLLVVPGIVGEHGLLPYGWPPRLAWIDMMNVVVGRRMFDEHKQDFAANYDGDWYFINSCMKARPRVKFFWRIYCRTQSNHQSQGKAEKE